MSERTSRLSRRHFLLAASAGGAATAAAIVAQRATSPSATSPASKDKRATAGYAETDHIRDYYRTAKV